MGGYELHSCFHHSYYVVIAESVSEDASWSRRESSFRRQRHLPVETGSVHSAMRMEVYNAGVTRFRNVIN